MVQAFYTKNVFINFITGVTTQLALPVITLLCSWRLFWSVPVA
jgi:hypothetical protein